MGELRVGRQRVPASDSVAEGLRILTICNACRYCEGYCAVFPALEKTLSLNAKDLDYLANLCHNCAECYYACQYAPPHEFAVNVPQALAEIRLGSYEEHARPRWMAPLFRNSWRVAGAVIVLSLLMGIARFPFPRGATFYDVVPHGVMVGVFGLAAVLIAAALVASLRGFPGLSGVSLRGVAHGLGSILTLEYLSSGGAGCTYPDSRHSQARRWSHHFTFYGFLLCVASTTVAAFYHYVLGRRAPYPVLSIPVILGTLGGLGLLIGTTGLYWLKRRRDPAIADTRQDSLDSTFLALLFASSVTGLLLLARRGSASMPALLVIHLAVVLGLFVTLPYGKFVHGLYRAAALLRFAMERE
ncbi:MAG: tricarballylate utilization 4Fe-4S protein TcuB [Acidobacteriia bacterium]|nr:tricarballylate utilization 4Fe-4S protein TcuB [Terriglobia bacterium]